MATRERKLVELAKTRGASLAGIAAINQLSGSPSQMAAPLLAPHSGIDPTVDGSVVAIDKHPPERESEGSVLVIGLEHPADRPDLDWWDGRGTAGNRLLIETLEQVRKEIECRFGWVTRQFHYYVERGGIYLKDAAVLAGLGCIGRNNLLVTPEYGPRVRLRGLYLGVDLSPTGPSAFNPCRACSAPCRTVCPEQALDGCSFSPAERRHLSALPAGDGAYSRNDCMRRMKKDEAAGSSNDTSSSRRVTYCRRCELVCPVGRTV
ncbi:hypothetical protein DPPLL_00520 [Desulfofustis limnaeus]|jgi:epoxyqueuosine reductase|uniref:Epoxyqueuosine reductase n=2 Tax=Desulfofustis limnaeus TaxID=2740163 RepID=A0ABN6LYI8_9BACT|nr:hypothetical protein DPPLL_00520 [Desulfofustis limnaeus]